MKRKLLTMLGPVAVVAALSVLPTSVASADQRTLLVTLLGGQQLTVQVDVPPGTPLDQVTIPGLTAPVVSIQDVTDAPAGTGLAVDPAAPATTTPAPTSTTPTTTVPAGSAAIPQLAPDDGDKADSTQKTTGTRKHKARREAETSDGDTSNVPTDEVKKDDEPHGADQAPDPGDPTYSLSLPGPSPIGVPNFFISKFRIPPFLLPIYQAAGIQYGVRWEVLAAINEIETDYGRNLNVSTAGAVGWMQFLPSTWKTWGVDANHDGTKDPYNPVDAIFATARYLKAAGATHNLHKAVFAYNHADWYVDSVLLRARLIGGLPADFVGSLTGLTQGHFPVHARATYADDLSARAATRRIAKGHNAAVPVESDAQRSSINIFAKAGSPVIAVQDGTITGMGENDRLGTFIRLRDVYGNSYTYGHLKKVASEIPVPKPRSVTRREVRKELKLPTDAAPTQAASAGRQVDTVARTKRTEQPAANRRARPRIVRKERLFANPARKAALSSGGRRQILDGGGSVPGLTTFKSYFTQVYGLKRSDVLLKRLHVGSKVIAGTILGRIGTIDDGTAPHTQFEIRPAGRGAPRIDPKPILDGWKLLESTSIYRAAGDNPFFGDDSDDPTVGQVLLMSKEALQERVLADPRLDIYACGRRDVAAGEIDRRVLATMEFLTASGFKLTITALKCGHSLLTTSGNVSEHSTGDAMDIAKVNDIPILGHQGVGSITDLTIRRLLALQGTMRPHQIISLMTYPGVDNTLALPDHDDHIHVGFHPVGVTADGKEQASVLKAPQWLKLIDRLNDLDNPVVPLTPSKYAVTVAPKRASRAHLGE